MEQTTLYYRQGSSDKVYQTAIEPSGDGYIVTFAYGRRGSTLNTGVKTQWPVLLAEARRIHQKLIQEKQAKGYTPAEDGTQYKNSDASDVFSGIQCQLLNPINVDEVEHCFASPDYWMQEKHDGRRLLIQKSGNDITGINRKGLIVPLPGTLFEDARQCKMDFIIDGEAVGDAFHAFDLLSIGGADIRGEAYKDRLTLLFNLLTGFQHPFIHYPETAEREPEKRRMFHRLLRKQREGVVFKDVRAPYSAGRPSSGGPQLKHKFYETASFVVGKINAKRSVGLLLNRGDVLVEAGNVTIPPNHEIPTPGQIAECRYLYAFSESGSVYQPTYLGVRGDVAASDCTVDQLKFKKEVSHAA